MLLVALSSEHSGEVAAALAAVRRTLARAGLDYHWLAGVITEAPQPQPQPQQVTSKWHDIIVACHEHPHMLRNEREAEFIDSLLMRSRNRLWEPTEKQESWLMDIYYRFA